MKPDVPALKTSWMGDRAILCDTASENLELALQERFWSLADRLAHCDFVREIVPGMNNLLVMIDPQAINGNLAVSEIEAIWYSLGRRQIVGREIDIPVRYGGKQGVDLVHVAEVSGLSVSEYVKRHSEARYTVFAIGSQPGFGYLAGLDPSLAVPRRDVPRLSVSSGSVVIGGAQAGVISKTSPSGWHIIGATGVVFFDPAAASPSLLSPGDVIRFRIESIAP